MTSGFDNQQLIEADRKLCEFLGSEEPSFIKEFAWTFEGFWILVLILMSWMAGEITPAIWLSIVIIGLLVYKYRTIKAYTKRISENHLATIATIKILQGPEELGKLYFHTPIPWRWVFLRGKPKKLADWMFIVALHLDWYQREPKQFLPARWIIQTILAIIIATAFFFGDVLIYGEKVMVLIFFAGFALFIFMDLGHAMKTAGARVLRAELQTLLPELDEEG